MSPTLSIITCAHNPKVDFLKQTLAALKAQTLEQQHWEFLLIDNASEQPLIERFDLSWHSRGRHVREEETGLTPARLRGICEAHGEVLVFVDDDNVLSANYLEKVVEIAEERQMIGAWSGHIAPIFIEEPPAWTKPYWSSLAIREVEQDRWSNLPHLHETMPCGAGLCVREHVAELYLQLHSSGQRKVMLDRAGNSLLGGGDNDLAACACDLGLGIGLFSDLKLSHLIPPGRLDEDYLVRLTEGIAYSSVILGAFRSAPLPVPRHPMAKIADSIRWFSMDKRQRRFYKARKRGEFQGMLHLASLK